MKKRLLCACLFVSACGLGVGAMADPSSVPNKASDKVPARVEPTPVDPHEPMTRERPRDQKPGNALPATPATPATPAVPGGPGTRATPAVPATPATPAQPDLEKDQKFRDGMPR